MSIISGKIFWAEASPRLVFLHFCGIKIRFRRRTSRNWRGRFDNRLDFINSVLALLSHICPMKKIYDDMVLVDSALPQRKPHGWRNQELRCLLENGFNLYTMYPALGGNYYLYGKTEKKFKRHKDEYLKYYPQNNDKIFHLYPWRKYSFKLAFSFFIGETYTLLPFYRRNKIPFAFVLYPGGAFGLNDKNSDRMLKEILDCPLFKKVIVTQKVTRDYLIRKNMCPVEKIEYVFGGYSQFNKNDILPKKYYKKDKDTIDICFVAMRYSVGGRDKGLDLFIEAAKYFIPLYDNLRFHVVGNFRDSDFNLSYVKDKIIRYGAKSPEFLKEFYTTMDICVSPHRFSYLFKGNFDGFPLGSESTVFGTLLMTTDQLKNNENLYTSDEIVIIKPKIDDIISKLSMLINDMDEVYRIGRNGQKKTLEILDPDKRGRQIAKLLKEVANNK